MAQLTRGSRPVSTIFDLLGRDENDVTFAIGWLLRESPEFLRLFLVACEAPPTPADDALVSLQRHKREEDLAGITDIEIVSTEVHVIVEAKRGWELPTIDQLKKYLPRLRRSQGDRRFVVLTRRSGASARVMVEEALRPPLAGFPIVPVGLTDVTRMARQALRVERRARARLFLKELIEYLEGAGYVQSHRDSRVLVVALADRVAPEIGIPYNRIPEERGFYWYGTERPWPKEPPKYFGFRFGGQLQSIHHVDDTQPFGAFREVFPDAKKEHDWGPGVLAQLGPAIRPNHGVETGRGLPFGRHAQVDIDLLLTCDSIAEAWAKTKDRDRLAKERGLA